METAAKDAAAGLVLGSAGGTVGGEIAHIKRKKNLDELIDKRKDWGIAFTKQSGKPKEAIDKLLEQKQGFVPKAVSKKGIGDIDFVWGDSKKGLQHIIERREQQGYDSDAFLEELPELFEKGDKYTKPNHPSRYYIGTNDQESAIRTDYNQKKRDWLTSAYYLDKNIPLQNSAGFRTYDQTYADKQFFPLSDLQKDNSIIPHSSENLNPNLENISKKPSSFDEWLEELKRKRKLKGW